jgi:transcriptional regulator with XRE-family HTH domain/predicted RNA-binding Zn-ribbon protein involved in translation (DUF1610 family)
MDQIRIGKFIANARKEKGMTQRELADTLLISDKTISKWECGKGLPEVSLMLPLCEALDISVNDLLSGERISDIDYKKKAEENMMNLMKENQENKKKEAIAIICAVITIIAVCSLVFISAYIEMHAAIRVALIVLAVVTAALGIGVASILENEASYFVCPHCHAEFKASMKDYVNGYHTFTKRYLKCPECGKSSMCKHKIVRK